MSDFAFESDSIDLPQGAWAGTHRRSLTWRGHDVLALTQGARRNFVFPLYTPAGFLVTTESPADHPHHNSLWIAADHLHVQVPAGPRVEPYAYNFYVNDVFQGRAPGRIVETGVESGETADGAFAITQELAWVGPPEWAAETGRVVARERRTLTLHPGDEAHVIDLESELSPTDWDIVLGPTRHAYFNFRIAESMRAERGGRLMDGAGAAGADAVMAGNARWVDYSGSVGGGHVAGIAMRAGDGIERPHWFATDWGVVTLQPFRDTPGEVKRGEVLRSSVRVIVHDGTPDAARLEALFAA